MSAAYAHLEPTCSQCDRAIESLDVMQCPNCGTPRRLRIDVRSADLFHRAMAVLRDADLVRKHVEPGGALGVLGTTYLGIEPAGVIWIDAERRATAAGALGHAGLDLVEGPRPIVDRSDPSCPHCDAALDPAGPATCGSCGGLFDWVDIDEPPFDTTGHQCRGCGYDMTGVADERCPECGMACAHDAHTLVAAATPATTSPPTSSGPEARSPTTGTRVMWGLTLVTFAVFIVLLLLQSTLALLLGGIAVILAVVSVLMQRA